MNYKESFLKSITDLVLKEADEIKEAAEYNGSMTDNGAGRMRKEVDFFWCGFHGVIPPDWKEFADQVKKNEDPEYQEYLRLQKKFQ